jgi:hypothetical protein
MAERVYPESYYSDPYNGQPSKREYERVDVLESAYFEANNDYGVPGLDTEKRTLWMDPENGIVVANVERYEAWLERLSPDIQETP